MHIGWSIALIALATVASAGIGILLAESPLGAVAGVPPAVVGIWQAWRGHTREQAMQAEIAELKARTRPRTPSEQMRDDVRAMARQARIHSAHADHDRPF